MSDKWIPTTLSAWVDAVEETQSDPNISKVKVRQSLLKGPGHLTLTAWQRQPRGKIKVHARVKVRE